MATSFMVICGHFTLFHVSLSYPRFISITYIEDLELVCIQRLGSRRWNWKFRENFFLKSTGTNTRFLELKLVFRHIVGLNLKYRLGHGPCQTVTSENLETRNSVSVNLRLEHKFGQTSRARISVSIRVHSSRDKQFISLVNCVTIKNPEIIAILK